MALPSHVRLGVLTGTLIVLACSCAGPQIAASGESIAVIGETFAATAQLVDDAHARHAVSADEYARWIAFSKRFQLVYATVAAAWLAAVKADMPEVAQREALTLKELTTELHVFGGLVIRPFDGGVP